MVAIICYISLTIDIYPKHCCIIYTFLLDLDTARQYTEKIQFISQGRVHTINVGSEVSLAFERLSRHRTCTSKHSGIAGDISPWAQSRNSCLEHFHSASW